MISLIMNLENQSWSFSGQPTSPDSFNAAFYIEMVPGKTSFKNFDFDFMIKGHNDWDVVVTPETQEEIIARGEPNVETEFPFLCNIHYFSNLSPGRKYTLDVSFKNRRKYVYDSYTITMPRPEKPHENWVWSDEEAAWKPPIPKPEPVWDELSQSWIIP